MLLRLKVALKTAWRTFEMFSEALDCSPWEEAQEYSRHLETRVAELERRLTSAIINTSDDGGIPSPPPRTPN